MDVQDIGISGLSLRRPDFRGSNLSGVKAAEADLELSRFDGANLRHVRMNSADVRGATLFDTLAGDADIRLVDFSYSDSRYSDFTGTNLDYARLDNVNFDNPGLSGVVGLENASVNNICYNSETKWTVGFTPPRTRSSTEFCGPGKFPLNK
ncbi:pentapeptide repeat-containing protein [Arthrobacter humicola]